MNDRPDQGQIEAGRLRYRMAAYSTAASIISKALSLLVIYLSISLTITYLGAQRFGVWMTLVSFISFLGFLDFGIGSSLVNEVAHASAKETKLRLKRLITHALVLLSGMGLALATALLIVSSQVDLPSFFGVSGTVDPQELRNAGYSLALLVGFSVPLVGLQRVFWGLQRAFIYHLLVGAGALLSLLFMVILARRHAGIGALILATYGVQLLATLPLLGILAYRGLVGSFQVEEFRRDARDLFRYGTLFFVLSIGGAIAWDSDYIIISRICGAAAVAVFAVGVRLFQLVEIPLQMINTPLWSAYADAATHGSRGFLRRTLLRAFSFTVFAAIVGSIALVLLQGTVVRMWIKGALTLPLPLVILMAVWTVMRAGGNSFAMYLNGIRLVKPQVVLVIGFCIFALPLKIVAAHRYAITGVLCANIASYILWVVIPYLTVYKKDWMQNLSLAGA